MIGQISINFDVDAYLKLDLINLSENEKKYLDLIYDMHKNKVEINARNIWKKSNLEMLVIYMQCVNTYDKSIL
ncbi:MAG: hypothetical protein WC679_13240 [Bacteroidales bacterium]|jgi:hypothetical protein